MEKILVIDDDDDIRELLSYNLRNEGYSVFSESNGKEGIECANQVVPDLILLDVMMPEMDGIEVCEVLRSNPLLNHVKICFLTARSEDYSQIAGLEAGADDYVSKPIKPKVLMSRLKAILRRSGAAPANMPDGAKQELIVDAERFIVILKGEEIQLPKKEFKLLQLLQSKPGKVFEREIILETVWGTEIVVGDRTIDVHIRKLREKIGSEYIKTVKGVGYKFKA